MEIERSINVDRRCEANPVVGGITKRLFLELGEVAEHLDELEAEGPAPLCGCDSV
jgi:hypothetical protein